MEKGGTCRATPLHVSRQGTNLLSSLILYYTTIPLFTIQVWRLVNIWSVSLLIVNSLVETVKKGVARSWFGGALAAWGIWLRKAGAALLDALCHVFSGEAESVWRRTSSPPPCTFQAIRADTQGWRPCQRAWRKKRKRKTETRAGLQIGRGFFLFWARLTVAFPCFCLRCGEPLLSHSPHLTWLSLFFNPSLLNQWIPAKHSHCIIQFQK